jgi:hypothetical protein
VYSTCLFCKGKLGSNEVIEHFPVGNRLAFDAEKGRLWVVCTRCGRWNLSPLEERWEAVEACERLFRETRTRAATEHIGLARLPAGLDLVRIGRPQRPEFAAWRYGDQFRSRNRRSLLWAGASLVALAGVWAGAAMGVAMTGTSGLLVWQGVHLSRVLLHKRRPVIRVTTSEGKSIVVRGQHAEDAKLLPSIGAQGWMLRVPHSSGMVEFEGESALHAAGLVFAHRNWGGATQKQVQAAVQELERVEHPEKYFATAAKLLQSRVIARAVEAERYDVVHLPGEASLALEMAAHEEIERQALEGELMRLEEAWREAEEIASIADTLVLPASVERFVARHRKSPSSGGLHT